MSSNFIVEDGFELDTRLNEETKAFVKASLRAGKPNMIINLPPDLVRQDREENARQTLSTVNFDITTEEFFVKNKVDNYDVPVTAIIPKNCKTDKLTVFFHGGGWTYGSRLTHFHCAAKLALATNTPWLSVGYRLAPEFKFETQIEDCKTVVDWALANKTKYADENAKIGVAGDSAGGHFSIILAHEFKSLIDYQVLVYPAVDLSTIHPSAKVFVNDCYLLVPDVIDFFIDNFLSNQPSRFTPRLSPLLHEDFSNVAKSLVIAAELDPLIDQSKLYHKKQVDNNIKSELRIINGTIHGFFHNSFYFIKTFAEVENHVVEFFNNL